MLAVLNGHPSVMRALLKAGAIINATTQVRHRPPETLYNVARKIWLFGSFEYNFLLPNFQDINLLIEFCIPTDAVLTTSGGQHVLPALSKLY